VGIHPFTFFFLLSHHPEAYRNTSFLSRNKHKKKTFPSNMSNGLVNGSTGIESSFGALPFSPITSTLYPHLIGFSPASLGINGTKSAYVPPHLRASQQRAASSPSSIDGYVFRTPLSLFSIVAYLIGA
jgi:hypothetical protein